MHMIWLAVEFEHFAFPSIYKPSEDCLQGCHHVFVDAPFSVFGNKNQVDMEREYAVKKLVELLCCHN